MSTIKNANILVRIKSSLFSAFAYVHLFHMAQDLMLLVTPMTLVKTRPKAQLAVTVKLQMQNGKKKMKKGISVLLLYKFHA